MSCPQGDERAGTALIGDAVPNAPGQKFLRDILASVSGGRFRLCETADDLPEILPLGPDIVSLAGSGLGDLRVRIEQTAREAGYDDLRWQDLVTAAGEAAVNAVVHGGGGEARVFRDADGRIQVWVQDHGPGIPDVNLRRATLERGFSTAGTFGHGFWMMRTFADRMWLLTGVSGTTVVLEQQREVRPAPSRRRKAGH